MTKKIIASFVGLTMALTMVPGIVQGDTIEDLQAQITTLMAQITALNTQIAALTGTTPATGVPTTCVGVTFTRNLSQGSSGSDVKCLQALLNTNPATQVALTGAGSPNNETNYFGPLTRTAVVKMQNLYAAEVLTPIGLTAGTGYVGTMTRAKLDLMLTTPVTPPVTPPVDGDDPTTPPPAVDPSEGYIEARWLPTPTGVELDWGATNVAVGAIELKAKDSAITVHRIDINLMGPAGTFLPWRAISYLSLYDGDNAIRGVEINSDSLYEVTLATNYRLRLTGLDVTVPEGGTKNITVKVNVPSYPRYQSDVTMRLTADSVRGVDTMGLLQYAPENLTDRDFKVKSTGEGARVETKLNDTTPPEGIALIDKDITTDHEVFKFDVKVTRDNVEIREMKLTMVGTDNINAVRLWNGTEVVGSQAASTTVTFEDLKIGIAKDSTKTFTVEVQYAATSTIGNTTVSINGGTGTTPSGVTALSASGESTSYLGSGSGNKIHFYEVVPELTLVSASRSLVADTTNKANAELQFRVNALGGDIYVFATSTIKDGIVATSTASSTAYDIPVTGLTKTAAGSYKVTPGTPLTFTVSGYMDNTGGTAAFYPFYLSLFTWDTTDGGSTNAWTHLTNWMVEKIRTTPLYLSL